MTCQTSIPVTNEVNKYITNAPGKWAELQGTSVAYLRWQQSEAVSTL